MENNFNFEEEAMDLNTPLDPITKTCSLCHKDFTLSPVEQKFYISHGYHIPNKCLECRRELRKEYTFTCCDCNKEFTIKGSEVNYYKEKGMELPKRCKSCIKFKKEKNHVTMEG